MVMQADLSALQDVAAAFGEAGQRVFLEATEGAVEIATQTAAETLKRGLIKHWPTSRIPNYIKANVTVKDFAVVGIVSLRHDWVGPLALGETVPAHRIPRSGFTPMTLKWHKGYEGSPGAQRKIDPRTGKAPIRRVAKHPGYKGKDCVTPAEKAGMKAFENKIQRVLVLLLKKLAGK